MTENFTVTTMTVGNYVFAFDFATRELRIDLKAKPSNQSPSNQTTHWFEAPLQINPEETIALGDFLFEVLTVSGRAPRIMPLTITDVE